MRSVSLRIASTLCFLCLSFDGIANADDPDTLDLVARPNQLPKGYSEYGMHLGFPAGPERDPPVDQWKYAGIGSWITASLYARVGVTDKVEVDAWGTLSFGHPENTPGMRPNRFGGVQLTGNYKLTPIASVLAGVSFIDPWLAMYGSTTFQHYYAGSKLRVAAHLGGRFGTVVAKKIRVQAEPRLMVVPGVETATGDETWLLAQVMVRADMRVLDDIFAGIRVELRTGNKLSPSASDGATLPVIAELRYVSDQVDLGLDLGFGSLLTSQNLASRVAYTEIPTSFYLGAVMNWRLP